MRSSDVDNRGVVSGKSRNMERVEDLSTRICFFIVNEREIRYCNCIDCVSYSSDQSSRRTFERNKDLMEDLFTQHKKAAERSQIKTGEYMAHVINWRPFM